MTVSLLVMGRLTTLLAGEADDERFAQLASEYAVTARPLVNQFCLDCHSAAAQEGELDLEQFASLADVRRGTEVWQRVAEMLDNGEMPPKDAEPQPSLQQRQQIREWAGRYLDAEALANAGDPGPVVLRRLNNAQYTYTIRDLTEVDLSPASEFPVDGAAGEGFTNTGNSLVMSPSLLTKYLDAGKEIANHAVLLPDGFRFSRSKTRPDWTNESLARIREFYREFTRARDDGPGTNSGDGTQVNLQGIQFVTNSGGLLPVEAYIAATLAEREPLHSGEKTMAEVARDRGLNAKYLGILWDALNDRKPSLLLDAVRAKWSDAAAEDAAALAAEIGVWQESLFQFSSVGHIGKVGGATAWQEPLSPLASRQEIRLKLPAEVDQEEVVLYLVAGDAGDGNDHDFAVWEQPRIVAPGRPDLLLRDVRQHSREARRSAGGGEPVGKGEERRTSSESRNGEDGVSSGSTESARLLGLDSTRFGKHPDGLLIDPGSLCVRAPTVLEVRLPAELAADAEFVTTGRLHPQTGGEGSVQFQVLETPPEKTSELVPSAVTATKEGAWTSESLQISHATPIIVNDGSKARERFEESCKDFRKLFPAALCYMEIVPVDEVVTLTLYYREDEALRRLMLDDQQARQLDRLWEELHFVSHDAITLVDAFEQLLEYASQDGDPSVFEPLRTPIEERAAAFRQSLVDAEPKQIEALVDFAARAYRRPLADAEAENIRGLYHELREQGLPHDEAFRFTLARIFIAPAFLYRLEQAPEGTASRPVSDWELANRLSYFLWSSSPDGELRDVAASGTLGQPDVLTGQARRMLGSRHVRRLATEFACQWLHIYDFDSLDEKSPEHFPEFEKLRDDMYEESILFFTDLFRRDASVLSIFDADHTFLNERLANFYGIPIDADADGGRAADIEVSEGWHRVDGVQQHARGGVLGLAAPLAKHSGASRSSPILRGIWVSETLLDDKLPNPPPGVPPFPEEVPETEGLTVRQLTELHTHNPDCAGCHARVDPFGFALESYDGIGRFRTVDAAGRPLDTHARLPDGTEVSGFSGLRAYLLDHRRDALIRQFCRKLLGYSLGRGVQLSDEPLLSEMRQCLAENDYRFSAAVEAILHSRQFREIRGRDAIAIESP